LYDTQPVFRAGIELVSVDVTALDTNRPIVTFQPAFMPAGIGCRYHIPVGASATVFVGFGVPDQVLNVEVTNIRLQPEIGADFYLAHRYRALFVAPRPALAGENFAPGDDREPSRCDPRQMCSKGVQRPGDGAAVDH